MYINVILILILFLISRYLIFEYYPTLITNGYLAIFISFCLITYMFTKSIIFSIIIGLITINVRNLYRMNTPDYILNKKNGFNNTCITCIGLIFLFFSIINFNYIDKKIKKYYNVTLLFLILINLFLLNSRMKCK